MNPEDGKRIGIISATKSETAVLAQFLCLDGKEVASVAGVNVFQGEWRGLSIIIIKSGVGKVHAAMGTQTMIDRFHPDVVVNIGTAASLSEQLSVGDVIIPTSAIQWDFNLSALYAHTNNTTVVSVPNNIASSGIIATGDAFVTDTTLKHQIREETGAIALDMESAAVAEVCSRNMVPCLIIKGISDDASRVAPGDLQANLNLVMFKACSTLQTILSAIPTTTK